MTGILKREEEEEIKHSYVDETKIQTNWKTMSTKQIFEFTKNMLSISNAVYLGKTSRQLYSPEERKIISKFGSLKF